MIGSVLALPAPPLDGNLGALPPSQLTELMSKPNSVVPASVSVATHTRTIGIIHPPPDIRTIIDKTARFIAEKGPELEKIVAQKQTGNANFNFLAPSNPYHAYYQHRLSEYHQSSAQQQPESAPQSPPAPPALFNPLGQVVVEPWEVEQYTVRLPEGVTEEELDIINITAQFVARNGKSFLTELTSKEMTNPHYNFLKPTHSLFMFFTCLADAYSKVLMPPDGLLEKLKKSVVDMTTVLERCVHRMEWECSQEQARQKAEDEIEEERIRMAMIDWHEFVVVETIDFADDEDEDLPLPMTVEDVIKRSKISDMEEVEAEKEVEMEMDEEEMQLVEHGMKVMEDSEPPFRVVKNWKRHEERIKNPTKYFISPITGELISVNEMSEHMRISLIDPKYKEQKERMFAKIRETTLAEDDEISRNIVGLAQSRPDIFGTTEEEVSNAVKSEIENMKDEQPMQVIWDGHTRSIGHIANQAMSQTDVNNEARNLSGPAVPPSRLGVPSVRSLSPPPCLALNNLPRVPPNIVRPPPLPPSMSMIAPCIPIPPPPGSQFAPMQVSGQFIPIPMQMMPPPPPLPQGMPPPPPPEQPEPKRQKLDHSMLIPEEQFLAQHTVSIPVGITISVPNVDEGNLKGQLLEIMVQSLSETVGSLKEKISAEIQLPANKQKLSGKLGFLKDNMSLAYYNVGVRETLTLSLRERGGRKK